MEHGDGNIKLYYVECKWSGGNLTVMDEYFDESWWKTQEIKHEGGSRILQGIMGKETFVPDPGKHNPDEKSFLHGYRATMTYDNKPSAFGSASILSFDRIWMIMFYGSGNNVKTLTETAMHHGSDWSFFVQLEYKYNAYGYPLRAEIIFDDYWYYDEEYSFSWYFDYNCN